MQVSRCHYSFGVIGQYAADSTARETIAHLPSRSGDLTHLADDWGLGANCPVIIEAVIIPVYDC